MIEYTYRSTAEGTYLVFSLYSGFLKHVAVATSKDNAELIVNALNRTEQLDETELVNK